MVREGRGGLGGGDRLSPPRPPPPLPEPGPPRRWAGPGEGKEAGREAGIACGPPPSQSPAPRAAGRGPESGRAGFRVEAEQLRASRGVARLVTSPLETNPTFLLPQVSCPPPKSSSTGSTSASRHHSVLQKRSKKQAHILRRSKLRPQKFSEQTLAKQWYKSTHGDYYRAWP